MLSSYRSAIARREIMGQEYNPLDHSVVQAFMGGVWCKYQCDDFVEALLSAVLGEIKRVHWNVYQHQWGPSWHADQVEDPCIDGIVFTRYYDGCECEDEAQHAPECRHARPNFQHEDVQFRWYKYPGRGMSTNKDWTAEEWRAWFFHCLATVRAFDGDHMKEGHRERDERLRSQLRERYPEAFNVIVADDERDGFRRMFDAFSRVDDAQTPCWKCSDAGFGSGGGVYEGGKFGTIARTLHEDDDPEGACRNCGHVNTDQQAAELDERRRKNSNAEREKWARMEREEHAYYKKIESGIRQEVGDADTARRVLASIDSHGPDRVRRAIAPESALDRRP